MSLHLEPRSASLKSPDPKRRRERAVVSVSVPRFLSSSGAFGEGPRMDWDDGVVRPVALDRLGQRYRRYRLADPHGGGGDGRFAAALGSVVAGGGLRARRRIWNCSTASSAGRRPRQVAGLTSLSVRVVEVDERTAKAAILGLNRGQRAARELEEAWIVQALGA